VSLSPVLREGLNRRLGEPWQLLAIPRAQFRLSGLAFTPLPKGRIRKINELVNATSFASLGVRDHQKVWNMSCGVPTGLEIGNWDEELFMFMASLFTTEVFLIPF
jgi:hypothetical protein